MGLLDDIFIVERLTKASLFEFCLLEMEIQSYALEQDPKFTDYGLYGRSGKMASTYRALDQFCVATLI
jgi:hypothetical protein